MLEEGFMEIITTFFVQIAPNTFDYKVSISDVFALIALLISLLSFRLQKKGNDTFKEELMSDAFHKSKEFVGCVLTIESVLLQVSRWTIGGINITQHYGKVEQYVEDEKLRKGIIYSFESTRKVASIINKKTNELIVIDASLKRFGYTLSKNDSNTFKELTDLGLNIDCSIRGYVNLIFDYFNENDHITGMRYSKHMSLNNGESVTSKMEQLIEEQREDIHKLAEKLSERCEILKQRELLKLYKKK